MQDLLHAQVVVLRGLISVSAQTIIYSSIIKMGLMDSVDGIEQMLGQGFLGYIRISQRNSIQL